MIKMPVSWSHKIRWKIAVQLFFIRFEKNMFFHILNLPILMGNKILYDN